MNSSPFLPAAPSTLNVGADDPVRPSFDFPPHPVGADAPSSAHIFEPILFFLLLRKKRTVSIFHEKKESNVPTVVLNLTQKISAIIRPLRQSLPSERSLRSAHRLSAELHSKTKIKGGQGRPPLIECCVSASCRLSAIIKIACGAAEFSETKL